MKGRNVVNFRDGFHSFYFYSRHLISQVGVSVSGKGVKITKFHLKTKTIFRATTTTTTTTSRMCYLFPFFCFWERHVLSVLQHNGILCVLHTNSESIYENVSAAEQRKACQGHARKQQNRNRDTQRAIKAGR